MIQSDFHIFQGGRLNHQPDVYIYIYDNSPFESPCSQISLFVGCTNVDSNVRSKFGTIPVAPSPQLNPTSKDPRPN